MHNLPNIGQRYEILSRLFTR